MVVLMLTLPAIFFPLFGQWQKNTLAFNIDRPVLVEVGDIDNDGDPDAAVTSYGEDKVFWYENNQLSWTEHIIDDSLDRAVGLRIADIDDDGDQDVVAAGTSENAVRWYKNDGSTPPVWSIHTIDDNLWGAHYVIVSDIDDDGDLDVLATAIDARLAVWYENDGSIPPVWNKYIIDSNLYWGRNLETGDIDDDGDLDVVATAQNADQVVWYANDLPNLNWDKDTIDTDLDGAWGVRIADIDGDDSLDIVATGSLANHVVWYKNENAGQNWTKYIIDSTLSGARCIYAVDVDKDQDMDVIVTGANENTVMWYENGGGTPVTWTKRTIGAELEGANYICAADINNDGYEDAIVTAWYANRVVWYKNPFVSIETLSGNIPTANILHQNYPNPFNPNTVISWQLAVSSSVQLEVYNLRGQKVAILVDEKQRAGSYTVEFDSSHLSSGVYFYRFLAKPSHPGKAGNYVETRKMVLMK